MASTKIFLKLPPAYCGFLQEKASLEDLALDIATTLKTETITIASLLISPSCGPGVANGRADCAKFCEEDEIGQAEGKLSKISVRARLLSDALGGCDEFGGC